MGYESDVEAALAFIELERSQKRMQEKANDLAALTIFLEEHPDFKEFYNLTMKVKNY